MMLDAEYRALKAALEKAGIENAAGEARILSESFRGDALTDAVRRRCAREPLQYILGEWDFCHETYEVTSDCLIPRADTELLVEKAFALLPRNARFLDLCTGSGCVAVSLLRARTDTQAVALDLFPRTLDLARRNAIRNNVVGQIGFLQADVLKDPPDVLTQQEKFDAILSNPPYIRENVLKELEPEVKYEPRAALCGGRDGLIFYRAILEKWRKLLKPEGMFLFEIGYDQGIALKNLAAGAGLRAEIFRDYGGKERVVLLR